MVEPSTRVRVLHMLMDIGKLPFASAVAIDETTIETHRESGDYIREATRICHNVYNNPDLLGVEPKTLCGLTNDDSRSVLLKRYMDDEVHTASVVQSMLKERYASSVSTNTTGMIHCRACKGTDVSFQQKQTRGADEAMTIFCVCVCGARWKMG